MQGLSSTANVEFIAKARRNLFAAMTLSALYLFVGVDLSKVSVLGATTSFEPWQAEAFLVFFLGYTWATFSWSWFDVERPLTITATSKIAEFTEELKEKADEIVETNVRLRDKGVKSVKSLIDDFSNLIPADRRDELNEKFGVDHALHVQRRDELDNYGNELAVLGNQLARQASSVRTSLRFIRASSFIREMYWLGIIPILLGAVLLAMLGDRLEDSWGMRSAHAEVSCQEQTVPESL